MGVVVVLLILIVLIIAILVFSGSNQRAEERRIQKERQEATKRAKQEIKNKKKEIKHDKNEYVDIFKKEEIPSGENIILSLEDNENKDIEFFFEEPENLEESKDGLEKIKTDEIEKNLDEIIIDSTQEDKIEKENIKDNDSGIEFFFEDNLDQYIKEAQSKDIGYLNGDEPKNEKEEIKQKEKKDNTKEADKSSITSETPKISNSRSKNHTTTKRSEVKSKNNTIKTLDSKSKKDTTKTSSAKNKKETTNKKNSKKTTTKK